MRGRAVDELRAGGGSAARQIRGAEARVRVGTAGTRLHAGQAGVGVGSGAARGGFGRGGGVLGDVVNLDFLIAFAGDGRHEEKSQTKM